MSDYKCGRCGTVYAFKEVWDLPERACKHCGYVFHQDKPVWKAYGEIKHHITSLHWLVNKLTHLAAPHRVDIELSTVFLEIAHDYWRGEPNWYETMFFVHREGERKLESPELPDDWKERMTKMTSEERLKFLAPTWTEGKPKVECWIQERYRTEEQAIEGHRRWLKLFEDGKYLITYTLERAGDDPDSKYKFEWRIDFDEKHRRILHGAKIHREVEGTAMTYMEAAR